MTTAPSPASAVSAPDATGIVNDLASSFRATAETVVPWFVSQMPPMYFQDTDKANQLAHLRAIIAAKASGRPIDLTLKSEDGRQLTLIKGANYPGILAELVSQLPLDRSLRAAKIHSSFDGSLVLDTFVFGEPEPFDSRDPRQSAKLTETIRYAKDHKLDWTPDQISSYFAGCSAEYVLTCTPLRIAAHWKLFSRVSGTDGTAVELESESHPTMSRIMVVVENARTRTMLERCARILARHSVSIHRAYLDIVRDGKGGSVTFVGFVVQAADGRALASGGDLWNGVAREMRRIKWVDEQALELVSRHPGLSIDRAEALVALCNLSHQVLSPQNRFLWTRERIHAFAEESVAVATEIVDLLIARFEPSAPMSDTDFAATRAKIEAAIARQPSEMHRAVLTKMLDAVGATLRTNYFLPERFALCLRIDPAFLANADRPERPYATFFVHGRDFDGFHNRFQDIARGGLRVIRTSNHAQHTRESERLFDEVYGLSWAQQLKNKDIPEGGAKAAILLEPGATVDRCVKAFVDSVLDLIVQVPEVKKLVVDRFGKDELIYLGPDENITPAHIEWIVARAWRRGYSMPTAFMSSKPGAGINHKVYGVTSEGVNVFLDVALRSRGIDPRKQRFTVKITGGPDGDVAGNMMRILNRDYGKNAVIVGVGDGSGCGEDPEGLDHAELLRLFQEGLPIASFDRSKLSAKGRIVSVDEPEGAQLRNTMHNRLVTDAFVPGGGRPATIHEGNWQDFLTADGKPSAMVVSEGANLFLTPGAREELSKRGATIIKDSSANKCGVICSSYEISACMVLSDAEFLSIKDTYVSQVLDRLRELARVEAEFLMRAAKTHPGMSLPKISVELSKVINTSAAAIAAGVPSWPAEDRELAKQMIRDHLPKVLFDFAGDRVWKSLPPSYQTWIIANRLASGIAYREGMDFFDGCAPAETADLARRYMKSDLANREIVSRVRASTLADKDHIAELLERGGARAGI
ncbi:MAG: NAD-glutamate dehydrogenase [Planctomycetaceae bacterium]|nr:NAD-glutamate dehydrogenase [Planctomycetaceae bacterium]